MKSFECSTTRHECDSIVWIESTDPPCSARLVFDPSSGIELTVKWAYAGPVAAIGIGSDSFDMIRGTMNDGRSFVLLDCFVTDQHFWAGGNIERRITANHLLILSTATVPRAFLFDEVCLDLSSFNEWISLTPLERDFRQSPMADEVPWLTIRCHKVPTFGFSPITKAPSFVVSHKLTSGGDRLESRLDVESKFILRLGVPAACTLEESQRVIFMAQSLLSMLCGHQVYIEAAQLMCVSDSTEDGRSKEVKFHTHWARPRNSARQRSSLEMLLNYPMVKELLPTLWTNWCKQFDRLQTSAELIMSPDLYEGGTNAFRFLASTQALETIHRNMYPGVYTDGGNYDTYMLQFKAAIDNIPNEALRQSLRARLRYGNEYSLRRRIRELCDNVGNKVLDSIFGDQHVNCIKLIVDTRNYLTHYDDSLRPQALHGINLHYASKLCRWLCVACLLRTIGVPEDMLAQRLNKYPGVSNAKKHFLDFLKSRSLRAD